MNEEISEQWVEALRSGKYQQTRGGLRRFKEDTYCCLGVLCDISKIGEWKHIGDNTLYDYSISTLPLQQALLPESVMKWAGMNTRAGYVPGEKHKGVVIQNDKGIEFEQIADYIEKNWKEL